STQDNMDLMVELDLARVGVSSSIGIELRVLFADEGRGVQQFCRTAFGLQVRMALNAGLVPYLNESRAAAMFLVAGTAGRREQYAVGTVRRRIMTTQTSFFRDRPEVHTTHAGMAGIALFSKSCVRGRDRPAGEGFRAGHPVRSQPNQRDHRYYDRQHKTPATQGMRPGEVLHVDSLG